MNDQSEHQPEIVPAEVVEVLSPNMTGYGAYPSSRRTMPPRKIIWPILLFIATCFTTFLAGIMQQADDRTKSLATILEEAVLYAGPLMLILVCHEMGHFLQSRRYGVHATYPYFIPFYSFIGTMGAVIFMEPRMGNRRALFDIGITGPLAGLVPTLLCCYFGIKLSYIEPTHAVQGPTISAPIIMGIIAELVGKHIPPGFALNIHPVAFAGWVGLLITSLNLFPIGQLDGGHVLYALLRKKAHYVARFILYAITFAIIWDFKHLWMWLPMLALIFYFGPKHPPTANDDEPIGIFRMILGWSTLAFVIVGFTPYPFVMW
jgi:membrane-associated protease RseP (regulator of RpoE activity)